MDGQLGWANKAALQLLSQNEWQEFRESKLYIFKGKDDFVFTTPNGKILQDLVAGCLIKGNISNHIGWHNVILFNGLNGFVESVHLVPFEEFSSQKTNQDMILDQARKWMGRPYLWGGTSPRAMDCSGYTKMIYHQFGYSLPRDASQQVRLGDTVSTDADLPGVLPGDFLFFGNKGQDGANDKITHVALYLGKGRIIHSTGQVKIESLRKDDPDFAPDRYKTFILSLIKI